LEYGQRLGLQQRNVAAAPGREPSTAARLFEAARKGSAAPAGVKQWGLEKGARADFLVLDPLASGVAGLPAESALDGLVFASQGQVLREVYVAGGLRWQVAQPLTSTAQSQVTERFVRTMQALV